jgi:hypothetical protein
MGAPTDTRMTVTARMREETSVEGKVVRIDRVAANRGDTVRWEAPIDPSLGTHTISVWFPTPGVFVTPVIAVMHRGAVEATIREDAEDGVYEYCVYDHTAGKFVVCESHPKLEIPPPGP